MCTYNNLKTSELETVDDEWWVIYARKMSQNPSQLLLQR